MMSGPLANFSAQERLRRRFAVWGLAIFGSLSGSGSVMLDRTSVWAADDPSHSSAASASLAQSSQACPRQADQAEDDSNQAALTYEQLLALLRAEKRAEATQRVDAALAAQPSATNYYLSYVLTSHLSRIDPAAAETRLAAILAGLADKLDDSASAQSVSSYTMSAQLLALLLDGRGESQQALTVLEDAAKKLAAMPASMSTGVLVDRCRVLIKLNRAEEAKAMMDKRVEDAFVRAERLTTLSNRMALPAAVSAYARLFRERYPDQLAKYRERAEKLLLANLDQEDAGPDDYLVYQALQIATAIELGESDARAANAMLLDLRERAARFKERLTDHQQKRLLSYEQTLKAALDRIGSKLRQEELIGQRAPEFEIASVINMEPVQWASLKGKVVLIDFWAVWCRPCIETFPYLRKLQQEHGKRGLVIIGVTRPYGYTWTAESKQPLPKEAASLDEELAMLEEFRKLHEIPFGFIVMPRESEYAKKFGVTGIPQAVVVDKNGVIQLIRVGADEKNASDVEAKIKELLDQPADAEDAAD